MTLHVQRIALAEQADGSARAFVTVLRAGEQETHEAILAPHVWLDLWFEVNRQKHMASQSHKRVVYGER